MSENNGTQTRPSQQAFNRAVRKAAEYVHAESRGRVPSLFALVPTATLADVPTDELIDSAPLTVVVQEPLPEGIEGGSPELADFTARISWPASVVGAVLAQKIMVIAPKQADSFEDASLDEVRARTDGETARQTHLFSGVISEGPHLALTQPRPTEAEPGEHGPFTEGEVELEDGSGVTDGVIATLYSTLGSAP